MSARGNPEKQPAASAMPDLVDLLLEVLQNPAAYRRFLGRLRPKLVGRPHPKRRLARLTGSLIRLGRQRVNLAVRISPFFVPPAFITNVPRRVVVTRPKQPGFIW